jgi:tRNA (cytosine38-C5)-methyltransferase
LSEDTPLQLLRDLRLRYFTPDELLRLFHFNPIAQELSTDQEPEFRWPSDMSTKTKYRLIGNSVNVEVVQNLITYLFKGDTV